jgi:hypothetical protein
MRLRSGSQYSNSLRVGRDRVQTHVNVRFSVPVETGPRAQTASSAMVTSFISPEVNQPGRVDRASQVKKKQNYSIPPLCFAWYRENFTTTYIPTRKKLQLLYL